MAKSRNNRPKRKHPNHLRINQSAKPNEKGIHWFWVVLPSLFFIAVITASSHFAVSTTNVENNPVEATETLNNQTESVDSENNLVEKASYEESETEATDAKERSLDDEPVDPKTWRSLDLVMTTDDGGKVEISLSRPLWWIEQVSAEAGKTITLDIPEMELSGSTKVISIKPLSSNKVGGDGTVTGTFKHTATDILDLQLAGEQKPIGVTPSHPFRSADRNGWIAAGELRIGERVMTRNGTTKVVSIKQRSGKEPVYNIEVHGTHTYYVGTTGGGALVHNTCPRVGTAAKGVTEVPLDDLVPLHSVPRPSMPPNHIQNIANAIKANGYDLSKHVPIAQMPDGRLVQLGGHHRAEAMRQLGETTIPGRIVDWNSISSGAQQIYKRNFPNFPW